MKKLSLLFIVFITVIATVSAQTPVEITKIIQSNNQEKLLQLAIDLDIKAKYEKQRAMIIAEKKGWDVFITNEDGTVDELMRVSPEGIPIYYSTDNADAAVSTRADRLHNGGSMGLNIEGQGMTAHVWDGGIALLNHVEFATPQGSKLRIGDSSNNTISHGTHVTGIIVASGVDSDAKGMAPQANGVTYDWNSDTSEMALAASQGALISNHSYGVPTDSYVSAPQIIGKYLRPAVEIDEITYNAPYFLPVYSSGNSGNDNSSNSMAIDGNSAYDKLTGDKLAKNSMVVANGQDAVFSNSSGSFIFMQINPSSSQGPADDLRIKPDITGNGTSLYSTEVNSNTSYSIKSGTSMASPNVAGSMLLLQQYYNELNGEFMRASTLKALVCHTAQDTGAVGPDAIHGWGLMNTEGAANAISNNRLLSHVIEGELQQGDSYSITVEAESMSDLMATIAWTDVAGTENTGGANDATPALVNDLDIRITQNNQTFEPWKLTGVNTSTTGDNTVDNVERVEVANASGMYTITVTHKGNLVNNAQAFSLVVTGVTNNYALLTDTETLEVCNDTDAMYPLRLLVNDSFTDAITLNVQGLPSSISSNFSVSSFTSSGDSMLSLGNLDTVADGFYTFSVSANTVSEIITQDFTLKIISDNFSAINPIFPTDQLTGVSTEVTLNWDQDSNAQGYLLELSENAGFVGSLVSETVLGNSFRVDSNTLFPDTTYYWRVQSINECGQSSFSNFSFKTFLCVEKNAGITTPIDIPDNNQIGIESTIVINESVNAVIGKITVEFLSTHDYSGDLDISLTSPAGTTVQLTEVNSCPTNDLDVTFDDSGSVYSCNTSGGPGYTGVVAPIGNLSDFIGETINGTWRLVVRDGFSADLGTLDNWKLNYCEAPGTLSSPNVVVENFNVFPNPSHGLFQVTGLEGMDLNQTQISIYDLNGRSVYSQKVDPAASQLNETIDVQNLSNGMYLLQVKTGALSSVRKIVINK